jgi:CspA family cold shock protein
MHVTPAYGMLFCTGERMALCRRVLSCRKVEYTMAQGTIKRITDRGFGFIDQGTGQDLFFHSSALAGITFDELRTGDRVEFERERDPRGRGDRAVNVRRMDSAPH